MKLSKKEAQALIQHWNVGNLVSYKKAEKGESNHNWIVKTEKGKFILRRAPNFRKLKDLRFELIYLTKLKEKGFPYAIPSPFFTKKGANLVRYKKGNWWLYKYIEGEVREPFSKENMVKLAEMMAIYHNTVEKMNVSNGKPKTKEFDKTTTLNDLMKLKKATEGMTKKDDQNCMFLSELEIILPLLEKIKSKVYDRLPQYALHRDLNPENILWKKGMITGVIDFENVGTMNENFITDLAIALMFAATTEKEHRLNFSKARSFIKSYQKYRKLSRQEISLIPAIITVGWIGAFSWQYWLYLYDRTRSQPHRIKLYSKAAQWHYEKRDKILGVLLK